MDQKAKENTTKDAITEAIGSFGRWQTMQVVLMLFPTKFSAIWLLMSIIFLAPKTTFRCVDMANSTKYIDNSTCYSECQKYEYYAQFDNTIISEWELICEREWLANLSQVLCMFGFLLGSIAFGFLADRFGRRPALLLSCMIQLAGSVATPFCPYFWLFATIRFLLGVSTEGIVLTSYIIIMETTGPNRREMMNSLAFIPSAIAEALMPLVAYYFRSWDMFCLGLVIPNLLFFVYFFSITESPKWLVSMGKHEEASKVMMRVAKFNGLPTENMLEVIKRTAIKANSSEKQVKATYIDLFRTPSLRKKSIGSCVIWFMMGLSYYGSHQFIGQTSTNVYLTIGLAGILQLPGLLLSSWCCRVIGRRLTIISFNVVSGFCNALLVLPDDLFYLKLVVGSVGISATFGAFGTIYLYSSELFPTVARNMGLGASSTCSRVGAMLAPLAAGLATVGYWVPSALFAVVPLIGAASAYCLPETRGQKLDDLLDE